MNVFILEDDPRRMVYFRQSFIGKDVTIYHFINVKPAIEFLDTNLDIIDRFYLDHDLGGKTYIDSNEYNTGFTIAKYLSEKDINNNNIVIHSMNYPAAMRMNFLLPGSSIIPFHLMFEKIN